MSHEKIKIKSETAITIYSKISLDLE
jgi:hypothetical protein